MAIDNQLDILEISFDEIGSLGNTESELVETVKQWRKIRAQTLSRPLHHGSLIDTINFYTKPSTLRLKYGLFMYCVEETQPKLYTLLTSIGFPKP